MSGLKVALLGGVPPAIGGGGLERQMERTAAALTRRGHTVRHVHELAADESFDLLHAFGNGADVWQTMQHWRKHPAPFVVSPIIVCSPGVAERKLRLGARLNLIPNINSMTSDILRRADHVVALTDYERRLVTKLVGETELSVIDNGVDLVEQSVENPAAGDRPYVVMLGSVSPRKGQATVIEKLGSEFRFVIVGGVEGGGAERAAWEKVVAANGAEWLGEIHDQAVIARILTDAAALVLFSSAEVQSLAVLEALAYGTPVVASDLPSHLELAVRWPGWVAPVRNLNEAGPALQTLVDSPPVTPAPDVPTWDDVARELETVYERLLADSTSS